MKAVQINEESKKLYIDDYPDPEVKEGELLINVRATGLNRSDLMQRRGLYPPPEGASPILGLEMAGVVAETGKGVSDWKKGDRVCALLPGGGYAEKVVIPADMAIRIPDNLSDEEGAAIPEVFLTAFLKLVILGKAKKGDKVLIHAGASGVGTAAIQLAKKLGCEVFTTAGSDEKLGVCQSLGADILINYKREDFPAVVNQQTNGEGVDIILDFIGAAYSSANLKSIAMDGRWILIGLLGGTEGELNFAGLLAKRVSLIASTLRSRSLPFKIDLVRQFLNFFYKDLEEGNFKPVIDSVYSWRQVEEAHRHMEQNKNIGKIILKIDG